MAQPGGRTVKAGRTAGFRAAARSCGQPVRLAGLSIPTATRGPSRGVEVGERDGGTDPATLLETDHEEHDSPAGRRRAGAGPDRLRTEDRRLRRRHARRRRPDAGGRGRRGRGAARPPWRPTGAPGRAGRHARRRRRPGHHPRRDQGAQRRAAPGHGAGRGGGAGARAPRPSGDRMVYGPADRCVVQDAAGACTASANFVLGVKQVREHLFSWLLEARPVGSTDQADFKPVAAGWMARGAHAHRGVGRLAINLRNLKAVQPAYAGDGYLLAGFANGPVAKSVHYRLVEFTPDGTAPRTAAYAGMKNGAGIRRVRVATPEDLLARPQRRGAAAGAGRLAAGRGRPHLLGRHQLEAARPHHGPGRPGAARPGRRAGRRAGTPLLLRPRLLRAGQRGGAAHHEVQGVVPLRPRRGAGRLRGPPGRRSARWSAGTGPGPTPPTAGSTSSPPSWAIRATPASSRSTTATSRAWRRRHAAAPAPPGPARRHGAPPPACRGCSPMMQAPASPARRHRGSAPRRGGRPSRRFCPSRDWGACRSHPAECLAQRRRSASDAAAGCAMFPPSLSPIPGDPAAQRLRRRAAPSPFLRGGAAGWVGVPGIRGVRPPGSRHVACWSREARRYMVSTSPSSRRPAPEASASAGEREARLTTLAGLRRHDGRRAWLQISDPARPDHAGGGHRHRQPGGARPLLRGAGPAADHPLRLPLHLVAPHRAGDLRHPRDAHPAGQAGRALPGQVRRWPG